MNSLTRHNHELFTKISAVNLIEDPKKCEHCVNGDMITHVTHDIENDESYYFDECDLCGFKIY